MPAGSVFVMSAGRVQTAAAPWKLLPAWQPTSSCVTGVGPVNVAAVDVCLHFRAQPVRSALFVQGLVPCTKTVLSVTHSGQGATKTGENVLVLPQGVT